MAGRRYRFAGKIWEPETTGRRYLQAQVDAIHRLIAIACFLASTAISPRSSAIVACLKSCMMGWVQFPVVVFGCRPASCRRHSYHGHVQVASSTRWSATQPGHYRPGCPSRPGRSAISRGRGRKEQTGITGTSPTRAPCSGPFLSSPQCWVGAHRSRSQREALCLKAKVL